MTALFAAAVALLLALPSFASADPLGEITLYKSGLGPQPLIHNVVAGPDGNVWFTDANAIGRITPSGEIIEYVYEENLILKGTPAEFHIFSGITAGPGKKLWFTDFTEEGPAIGVLDPATCASECEAEEFLIEAEGGNAESKPLGITAGPDGNIWFTDTGAFEEGPAIGRINPITHKVKEFPLGEGSRPQGIVAGPDGNIWFTDTGNETKAIGKLDLGTEKIEEFSTGENSEPGGQSSFFGTWGIAAGPDGNVWFTENGSNTTNAPNGKAIGRITPAGTITYFSEGLIASSKPFGITSAPGGKLWFTDGSEINETQELEIKATENLGGTYKLGFEGKETGAIGTGTLTSGSKEIKSVSASSGVFVKGEEISGTGISAGTFIEKCNNGATCGAGVTKVFLTQAATETKAGVALTANLSATSNSNNTFNTIRQALESLSTIGSGNVSASGTGFTSPEKRTITFIGALQALDVPQVTCNGAGLSGTSASCAVTTTVTSVPNAIGSITTTGKITRYPSDLINVGPEGITSNGSEDNVWFTNGISSLEKLGKFGIEEPGSLLTVTKTGAGSGTVTSEPPGINCGSECEATLSGKVKLTASPESGSEFRGWSGACKGAEATCVVEMSEEKTVNAFFSHAKQTLTVKHEGTGAGTTSSKPKAVKCAGTCTEAQAALYKGTTVLLTAKAMTGSNLTGFSGCESTTKPTEFEGTCTVTMSAAKEVKVTYGLTAKAILNPVVLTLKKATGTGKGTVKATGLTCEADCTSTKVKYTSGDGGKKLPAKVVLKETPALGSTFTGWTGCESNPTPSECVVTTTAAKEATAGFDLLPTKTLTVAQEGTGAGTTSSKPKGIKCAGTCTSAVAELPEGTTVLLTAKAMTGSNLTGFSGCESTTKPTEFEGTCTVTMSAAKEVKVTYGLTAKAILNPVVLTLKKAGTGFGTIKATGLTCEVACTSTKVKYTSGDGGKKLPAKVVLKATSQAGSDPVSWTGCESNPTPSECVVTTSAAKEVTARFEE